MVYVLVVGNSRYIALPSALPSLFSVSHYLMNSGKSILENFESLSDNVKKDILLYGDSRLDGNKNEFILEATLTYIKSTDRFSGSILD